MSFFINSCDFYNKFYNVILIKQILKEGMYALLKQYDKSFRIYLIFYNS